MIWKNVPNNKHSWAFYYFCKSLGDKVTVLEKTKDRLTLEVEIMETHEGNVSYVGSKTLQSGVTLYSFAIAGRDGFFLCGDTKPDAQKGQKVRFLADGNKVDMNSLENLGYPEKKNTNYDAAAKNTSGSMTKNDYWEQRAENDEHKEIVMALENARYSALHLLQLAKDTDAIQLPQKKGDKLPALEEMLEEYTQKFFRHNIYAEKPDVNLDTPETKEANEEELDIDDFDELDEV